MCSRVRINELEFTNQNLQKQGCKNEHYQDIRMGAIEKRVAEYM